MTKSRTIVITAGEPAGIGPELLVMLAQQEWPVPLVACADGDLLLQRAKMLNLPLRLQQWQGETQERTQLAGTLALLPLSLQAPAYAGELNSRNSKYVLQTLTRACQGCLQGEFAAMVTGPVHKGIINDAGIAFSGHTEFLAEKAHCPHVVMMLANDKLRVALATTHLPLQAVPAAITQENLSKSIQILHHELQNRFAIPTPQIYISGLNPHAGEGGHLGHEEQEIIIPVLEKLRRQGMELIGPLAADTLFQGKYLQHADAVLCMYHDQGLPVLKYQGFGNSINITLGLPFVRTSVDHGTALELAGKGLANPDSFIQAVNSAIHLSRSNQI